MPGGKVGELICIFLASYFCKLGLVPRASMGNNGVINLRISAVGGDGSCHLRGHPCTPAG